MEQRISLVTLGIADLTRGRRRLARRRRARRRHHQPPAQADWGGTTGAFADPDGYVREVAQPRLDHQPRRHSTHLTREPDRFRASTTMYFAPAVAIALLTLAATGTVIAGLTGGHTACSKIICG